MRWTILRSILLSVTLLAGLTATVNAADDKEEGGFKQLFNGKDFTGWKFVMKNGADPKDTWSVQDGVIVCTGHPFGFLYTEQNYKDYVLRYEWRYKRPDNLTDETRFSGNSGCLVHIHNPQTPATGGLWPQCVEVQGMNLNHGQLLFLKTTGEGKFDRKAKNEAIKPVGEWNSTEVTCHADGSIDVKVNGARISSGRSRLTEGHIGYQSEGAEIHYRNIRIKERR